MEFTTREMSSIPGIVDGIYTGYNLDHILSDTITKSYGINSDNTDSISREIKSITSRSNTVDSLKLSMNNSNSSFWRTITYRLNATKGAENTTGSLTVNFKGFYFFGGITSYSDFTESLEALTDTNIVDGRYKISLTRFKQLLTSFSTKKILVI